MMNKFTLIILIFSFINISLCGDLQKTEIDSGLSLIKIYPHKNDQPIYVLKMNPQFFQLEFLSSKNRNHENLTAKEWAKRNNFIAVTNAGMFADDYETHVGYMKHYSYKNNAKLSSKYQSVAVFNPVNNNDNLFYIYDLDKTPFDSIEAKYNSIVQNLRLIKRPKENRWSSGRKKWSEAALGQDKDGHILFIFSRSPYTMYEFNNLIIKYFPSVECVQHLEGGPEASLFINYKDIHLELMGSYETDFTENDNNKLFWTLPNIIGVRKR